MSDATLGRTPLYAWHREQGGKMVAFAGWEMPVQYETGILTEHLATRKSAGLFDVSHMGRVRVKGVQTIAFLQHVLTSNVEALKPWRAQYTLLVNPNGGVLDDAFLYRFGETDYLLVVNASNREADLAHLRAQARRFPQVELDDQTFALAMFALQGPISRDVVEGCLSHGAPPEPAHNSLSEGVICGARVLIGRTGYTGEPIGFELFVPVEKAVEVFAHVYEKGKARGAVPAGLGARDTLRLEASMPLYGHEFGKDTEGQEIPAFAVPLARVAVSFSPRKGDFIGREALARQFAEHQKIVTHSYQPSPVLRRRSMAVALLDKGVARQGDRVFIGEKQVGVVSSGTIIPYWCFDGEGATVRITETSDRRGITLAFLDAEIQADQDVDVVVRNRRMKAIVVRYHGRSEASRYFRSVPSSATLTAPSTPDKPI